MMVRFKIYSLLSCLVAIQLVEVKTAEVTHDEIRDAILSLVTIFKDSSDKLERHEHRERQLGDQLKKALAGLDKRNRNQDQAIVQLLEKVRGLDALINLKEERQMIEMRKVSDTVNNVQQTLDKLMKELQGSAKESTATYTVQETALETSVAARLDRITTALESDEQTRTTLRETERLLRSLEESIRTRGSGGADEDIRGALDRQNTALNSILNIASQTALEIQKLPTKQDVQESVNGTAEQIHEIRSEILSSNEKGVALVMSKIEDKANSLSLGQEDIMKTATEVQSMTESLNGVISKSYDQLLTEIRGLSKVEQVMIQTADNVMDTKRRIEYGVHQILLEVGEVVKNQGKTLNGTVNRRFDDIESTILDNQTGALSNLSSKIEQEISQVWRQIGIMYQQLTASATALDRLQQQTDAYVNGSVKVMDSMEGKVAMISERMTEADENLNFLLGRLNLVTSEYNQIKQGLSGALDDIRNGFLEVQGQMKDLDLGPGPRPIATSKETGNDVPAE